MLSDLFILPRPSSSLQLTRASLELVDGCTTCRANTTCFQRRAFPTLLRSTFLLSPTFCSVSTLRSAIELKAVFDQIQQAEQSGNLSAEEKKRLEEQAAEKGLQALFKVRLCPLPCPSLVHRGFCLIDARALYIRARSSRSTRCCERRATGC